jgi:hemerythrin
MSIIWDDAYITGSDDIDRQHRELLHIVDELGTVEVETQGSRQAILGVLTHITDFAISHFLMEEDLMQRVAYPAAATESMVAQHREFTSYARMRVLEFRKGELISVRPLRAFLCEWLTLHEFGLDRVLADFIRERAEG